MSGYKGQNHDMPPNDNRQPTSISEARNEMRRLMRILLGLNRKYLEREKEVVAAHAEGRPNFSGNLSTVLDNDLLLKNYSGGAKTVSILLQGIAAYLQAELAIKQHLRGKQLQEKENEHEPAR